MGDRVAGVVGAQPAGGRCRPTPQAADALVALENLVTDAIAAGRTEVDPALLAASTRSRRILLRVVESRLEQMQRRSLAATSTAALTTLTAVAVMMLAAVLVTPRPA